MTHTVHLLGLGLALWRVIGTQCRNRTHIFGVGSRGPTIGRTVLIDSFVKILDQHDEAKEQLSAI